MKNDSVVVVDKIKKEEPFRTLLFLSRVTMHLYVQECVSFR